MKKNHHITTHAFKSVSVQLSQHAAAKDLIPMNFIIAIFFEVLFFQF